MSRRPLPFNAAYAFIIAARHLNLTKAAQELCITQGAVSRKIATLESWLGFPLFERHARGLHLTPRGASLLPALNSSFEQMMQATEEASNPHATLRLKAPTCAMRWLVPRLVALEQTRPDLHVSLTTTVDHSLHLENYDAAILYGTLPPGGYRLFAEELTPVIAPELVPSGQLTCEDLAGFTFLHPTADGRDWMLWLNAQGIKPVIKRHQHFDTMDLAISAAVQGFGITVADVTLIEADLAAGRLIAPFSGKVKTGAVYSLIQRPSQGSSTQLAALVAWLCDADPSSAEAGKAEEE